MIKGKITTRKIYNELKKINNKYKKICEKIEKNIEDESKIRIYLSDIIKLKFDIGSLPEIVVDEYDIIERLENYRNNCIINNLIGKCNSMILLLCNHHKISEFEILY